MKKLLLLLASLYLGCCFSQVRADTTWTSFQTIYSDPPAGTIEIAFAAGKFKYDGGAVKWDWKIRSTFKEPVSGDVRIVALNPAEKNGMSEANGSFKCAPEAEQTNSDRLGQWTIGTEIQRSYLVRLKIGNRVVVEANKVLPPQSKDTANSQIGEGVNEIEFPGAPRRDATGKLLGPDENFSGWRSLGAGNAEARVRRLGPKNAQGLFEWGIEVRNNSTQTQKYTLAISGGLNKRQENLLLASKEVFRAQFSTTAENEINLQVLDATPTNFMEAPIPGAAAQVILQPTSANAPKLDEKTRAAKLEALNEQLLAGLTEMDPTNPNESLANMNRLTEQMWTLMEQDPDSDSKKLVSLLRLFSRADTNTQTTLLAQIMALIMTLAGE